MELEHWGQETGRRSVTRTQRPWHLGGSRGGTICAQLLVAPNFTGARRLLMSSLTMRYLAPSFSTHCPVPLTTEKILFGAKFVPQQQTHRSHRQTDTQTRQTTCTHDSRRRRRWRRPKPTVMPTEDKDDDGHEDDDNDEEEEEEEKEGGRRTEDWGRSWRKTIDDDWQWGGGGGGGGRLSIDMIGDDDVRRIDWQGRR